MNVTNCLTERPQTVGNMETNMASNQQFKLEALQKTEAISDALFDLFVSGNVDGYLLEEGDRLCASGDGHNKCLSSATITLAPTKMALISMIRRTVTGVRSPQFV